LFRKNFGYISLYIFNTMQTSNLKKISTYFLYIFLLFFFVSCQKNERVIGNIDTAPDLTTKVESSVSGFVTDENNAAVNGAAVSAGNMNTTTDKYGYFEIRNVQVIKEAAVVTVNSPGYFKGIKTYIASDSKAAFFRIKLLPKTNAGTIDAAAGGSVNLTNGLTITLPANGVINAVTNAAYAGQVNLAVKWIDPTGNDMNRVMPGDLRGIDNNGAAKILTTYGMAAVELTNASGDLLQIAAGKKATVSFPIPASIAGNAPASVPLWYFDETTGLWKEEGSAAKSGNNYVGEVSHFSFWNCDLPANYVQFNCIVKDANGQPVPGVIVKVSVVGNLSSTGQGYTDSSGYIGGAVPGNAQLLLEVFSNNSCSNDLLYSQNFTTAGINISLGTITLPATNTATITGNVLNCSSNPVSNGYIIMKMAGINYRYPVNNKGIFNFTLTPCINNPFATLIAEDNDARQQAGSPVTLNIIAGNNNVGTLTACGISNEQFINYSVNGVSYPLTAPADTIDHTVSTQGIPADVISGVAYTGGSVSNSFSVWFTHDGIALNSIQSGISIAAYHPADSTFTITSPINVNITEYGAVGQFISGNFTGILTGAPPANKPSTITCQFRVRRNQ
jgi:hypothetical protein